MFDESPAREIAMTGNAYMRKKQPDAVRRALLDAAARIAQEQGLTAMTVQAVATAAGVTKGGLFHHFPSKQALVAAVHADLFDKMDAEVDGHMAQDPQPAGSFTRAYVEVILSGEDFGTNSLWVALSGALLADFTADRTWPAWIAERLERHRATDDTPMLEIVRYAADGAWFTYIAQPPAPERLAALRATLIAMTRQP